MHADLSIIENSAQGLSCQLKFVHEPSLKLITEFSLCPIVRSLCMTSNRDHHPKEHKLKGKVQYSWPPQACFVKEKIMVAISKAADQSLLVQGG
jgi:hypothetical protein